MGLLLIDENNHAWDMVPMGDEGYYAKKFPRILLKKTHFKTNPFYCNFPKELVTVILSYHVEWLLKETQMMQALEIIYLEPIMVKRYYKRFCNEALDHLDDRERVSSMKSALYWIFMFSDAIYTDTFKTKNQMNTQAVYFELNSQFLFTDATFSPRKIFNKFDLSVLDLADFNRNNEDYGLLALTQGPRYADIIWFNGQNSPSHRTLFEYESFERPVIVLCISDDQFNLLTAKDAREIAGWKEFIDLLYYIGGEHTVVYFCDKIDDGEFLLSRFVQ